MSEPTFEKWQLPESKETHVYLFSGATSALIWAEPRSGAGYAVLSEVESEDDIPMAYRDHGKQWDIDYFMDQLTAAKAPEASLENMDALVEFAS